MAELGQQTVEFSTIVRRAAEESFLGLKELVEESKPPDQKNSDKRHELLKYIVGTRQRMLRLLILAKWCRQVPLVQYCQQLSATLSSHDTCFTQAADSLFFMHEGLQQARAPIYDVPSAIEVLLTGSYQRLPKCIEDVGIHGALSEAEQGPALKKLDTLLRSRLLEVSLPKEISEITVSDGTAQLRVDGEFKVLLTLGYRGHLSMWRILHLELLVGEKSGLIKLEEMRRHVLGDDLERRMAASDNPFFILYSILHELCVALIMDTVIRQVQALRQGRWKDVIRFELISDGSVSQAGNTGSMQLGQDVDSDSTGPKTPGLKITYWLDTDKNVGGSDLGLPPCIIIEPGQDLHIKCIHDSFVIDPQTGKGAEFSLNLSCIDVEKLLLRVIAFNKHTRLLEIYKELLKNSQICQATGDVVLKCQGSELDVDLKKKDNYTSIEEYGIDEVLLVRAYGSLYIILGINIRSGRFFLQSSRNIVSRSTLLDFEEALNQGCISAAEVFTSLRTKSILHLFASIGRFLGLKVYEQGLAAVRIPKSILNGSDLLLMGFPQCGGSYYLLMQLDKDFKPLFKLLETQPDPCGRSTLVGDSNYVVRSNKINVGQMQMVEDELNLSLLDWERLLSFIPNYGVPGRTLEHSLVSEFGQEASLRMAEYPQSSFSSVVDKVFELEKGVLGPSFPTQNHLSSSFNTSPHSYLGSVPMNPQVTKGGLSSIKWDGGPQLSHINNITKVSSAGLSLNSSQYPSSNMKGLLQSGPVNSFSSSPVRSPSIQRLRPSKSDQELSSHKSPPHSVEVGSRAGVDEDQLRLLKESPKEITTKISGSRPVRMSSPLRTGSRVSVPTMKQNLLRSPPTGNMVGSLKTSGASSWTTSPVCTAPGSLVSNSPTSDFVPKHDKDLRKHSLSDVLKHIPSLRGVEASTQVRKRRKISDSANLLPAASESSLLIGKTEGYTYGSVLAEANHGCAPSGIYVTAFLHVVRHCSLCIKHARLTSQMDALDIPYVEEVGLRIPSSNLWFRLPFARDDSWQHICLRLGRPGSMCWDVKVNDQHFRDLWDLQKNSSSTAWGCGVRIANTSDVDSHIRYNSEGVVLSYKTVEDDSIRKLVADLRRLSNARSFAIGMRKLLGVRAEDKLEDGANSEIKSGAKGGTEVVDKMSEQMRRAFRIEAVGLMSLWFSFGSMPAVMARFVVEWEAGKEGCTMHVSPDQLWPHTKFLEDFINGAEVASLLDCIRLTAGPLLALAGAIRPARMTGPTSPGIHGASGGPSLALKQNGFVPPSQVLPPNSSTPNTNPPTATAPVGNSVAGSVMGPLGNHSLQSVAMLSVAGRGGPGIVPSSLLPIDVSVVLRGPYWIRIIYRKNFAVDMRCFAGDHVWLQPATPAKREPEGGGSLPCPQFRPFIMEHVAQGLNALEQPNFTVGTPNVGAVSSSTINATSSSQTSLPNGNRLNLTSSGGISRPTSMVGNQGANLSRVTGTMLASSCLTTVGSGLPIRPPQGASVPVHVRGDLNTAFIGLGDDGGYGGGFVPLAALKKVLRGILKYLGVLWLFAQLPGLLKEILGSILKENEGALLNLDQEQPALRFFVGGYVFAVSVHRVQLLLQVLSVKRFHQQQQQQQQQNQNNAQDELAPTEISEICDYFSRRVASEPYDASRVASFITLLTLPISVLREFLRLIAWKKGLSQVQGADMAPAQRPRIELCLENHTGYSTDESSDNPHTSRSNIHYDRARNAVDFGLTFVLDPAHIPHINAAGGAAWLPYCVSVRLRYSFGESTHISLIGMEGSHGGRACWSRVEDWEKCKHRVARAVEFGTGNPQGDSSQGRLRVVADALQRTLQMSLQQLRDSSIASFSNGT